MPSGSAIGYWNLYVLLVCLQSPFSLKTSDAIMITDKSVPCVTYRWLQAPRFQGCLCLSLVWTRVRVRRSRWELSFRAKGWWRDCILIEKYAELCKTITNVGGANFMIQFVYPFFFPLLPLYAVVHGCCCKYSSCTVLYRCLSKWG